MLKVLNKTWFYYNEGFGGGGRCLVVVLPRREIRKARWGLDAPGTAVCQAPHLMDSWCMGQVSREEAKKDFA